MNARLMHITAISPKFTVISSFLIVFTNFVKVVEQHNLSTINKMHSPQLATVHEQPGIFSNAKDQNSTDQ